MIYLIELEGLAPGATVPKTLRYSTGEGFVTAPGESPPNTPYLPRVTNPGTFERHSWRAGTTRGRGEVSFGAVSLANLDGKLDFFAIWDWDGRPLTILRGMPGAPRASFVVCLKGTMDGCAVSWSEVTLRVRDAAAYVADKPIVTQRFLGNNVLPNGSEGVATDLKNRTKPLVVGEAENFIPPRVNTSALVYQVSSRQINAILGVYDNGNSITAGVSRASLAALMATAPAAGVYDWSLGSALEGALEGAYFRLGSSPGNDTVTCWARSAAAAGCSAAQCATAVLVMAGVAPGSILGAAALDAVQPAPVGYWIDAGSDTTGATDLEATSSGTKCGDVLDSLCSSIGASWTPNRAGAFILQRLTPPTGTASVVFSAAQILDGITFIPTEDDSRGVPAYEIELRYGRNFNTMSGAGVAGAVTAARADWLKLAYRTARASNNTIWNPVTLTGRNPSSLPLVAETLLRTEVDAIAEAARLLAMYGTRRTYVSFQLAAQRAAALDLGTLIGIDVSRFSLAGKLLVVTGLVEDFSTDTSTVFAWG